MLYAPKEQLLICVDKEILGNILYSMGHRSRDAWVLLLGPTKFVLNVQIEALPTPTPSSP